MLKILTCTLLIFASWANTIQASSNQENVGEAVVRAIIQRYQPTIDVLTLHGWDHSNSIVLHGIEKIYEKNKNPEYLHYIKAFADDYIDERGQISGLLTTLDGMHPGVICLFLYEKTGEEKYRIAAKNMRDHLIGTEQKVSPFAKTPDGIFWHKNNAKYKNVISVDGLYMKDPFLVRYGLRFDEPELVNESIEQVLAVARRSFNIRTNLAFHAWSYDRDRAWADKITGQATQHWSRASAWFAMALVDILEYLPKTHPQHEQVLYLFQRLAQGIKASQHPQTKLWYQVLDKPLAPGNYPELSASGMMIYALQKGVNMNLLDSEYQALAADAWSAMQAYVVPHEDGGPQIKSVAPGMSSQLNYEAYVNIKPISVPQPGSKQYSHGYIGVLMAASVME
jgi:unsaturated rhamnogalacturonyl hydrolase